MTKLKRYTLLGFLFVSILGTLTHFFYEWSNQNYLIGFISPINESTWEHMKLLYFPALLYLPFITKKLKADYPYIAHSMSCGIILGTWTIPTLFYTYSGVLGFNLTPLDILCFFLSVANTFLITHHFAKQNKPFNYMNLWFSLLLIQTVCFFLFTYMPPQLGIFSAP